MLVDGMWSVWNAWGACDATCGDGNKARTRACDNPAASNGGAECSGEGEGTDSCNEGACPGSF